MQFDTSQRKQILDITDDINSEIEEQGLKQGLCHLHITHTTAALTTADLDPGTDQDMLDAFEAVLPKLNYRHPHDPSHVGDHIMSSLIGSNITVPVRDGVLTLGVWQRVVLVEFNEPRQRDVALTFLPAQTR